MSFYKKETEKNWVSGQTWDRLVTNLEKGEKFNKDVCQVFLDDSEAVLRDGVDYEVRHSFDGPDHWHGSSVHSPESPPALVTNSGSFYYFLLYYQFLFVQKTQ